MTNSVLQSQKAATAYLISTQPLPLRDRIAQQENTCYGNNMFSPPTLHAGYQ